MEEIIKRMVLDNNLGEISGLYTIIADSEAVDALESADTWVSDKNSVTVTGVYNTFEVTCKFTYDSDSDTYLRRDSVKNISDKPIKINKAVSRFAFDGCPYELYTQRNSWQHENVGAWQKIESGAVIKCRGFRTCDGMNPYVSLWDYRNKKGMTFNIVPSYRWNAEILRIGAFGEKEYTVMNYGIEDSGFSYELKPGEELMFSEMLFYFYDNKTDMGSYKLHKYINAKYPRKQLPVLYNSWLYKFHHIGYDELLPQVDEAADLGCEYFVVDAGWFGNGEEWTLQVGNWTENKIGAFGGRMKEFADYVRSKNMKFGLWLEPERAAKTVEYVKTHSDFYMKADQDCYVLDFANDKAREYITKKSFELIDEYGIEMFKIDCNTTTVIDKKHASFVDYYKGLFKYFEDIKKKYPGFYIEDCSAGGIKNDLEHIKHIDTCFISDMADTINLVEIYVNLLFRLPPSCISKWGVTTSIFGLPEYDGGVSDRLLTCADGLWKRVESVDKEFLFNFLLGGTVGFGGDLARVDEKSKEYFKHKITEYKENREFFQNCAAYILVNEPELKIVQYMHEKKSVIDIYFMEEQSENVTFYPVVKAQANYRMCGKEISGESLMRFGIKEKTGEMFTAKRIVLDEI